MKSTNQGLKRIINATGYSLKGLKFAWLNEAAFREEVVVAAVAIPLAIWLGDDHIEQALMIICCFLVLIAEVLNSAIEAVVDRISEEHHPLSGSAKDLGSAAVFLSLGLFIVVWALMLLN